MYNPTFEEICQKVNVATGILFKNDIFLLEEGVHERSISHKLAEYLQTQFPDWNVDCEYNKIGVDLAKKLKNIPECDWAPNDSEDDMHRVYPDIIIHKRKNRGKNLLVIEIKAKDSNIKCDLKKLELFTKPDLNYSFGLFILFCGAAKPYFKWFKNGEEKSIEELLRG